jgi:ABC-2 type transport system permease protein
MNTVDTWLTLIRREWLQHRVGWTVTLIAPIALMLLAVTFGNVQFDAKDQREIAAASRQMPGDLLPSVLGATVGGFTFYLLITVVLGAALFMADSLARKDNEDRSNEFWLSMPLSHSTSVGATVLAHWVVMPAVALLLGLLGALIVGVIGVLRAYGTAGLGLLFTAEPGLPVLSIGLRVLAGLPFALFWLAPIYLSLVAAGAWFKRWGLPLVIGGGFLAHGLVGRLFDSSIVADVVGQLFSNAAASIAVMHDFRKSNPLSQFSGAELTSERIWQTFGSALETLVSPLAALALLVSVAMFWLVVHKRQHSA